MIFPKFAAVLTGLALAVGPMTTVALADESKAAATEAQEQQLQARIDQFNKDFTDGNYGAIVEVMPPKILTGIAEANNVPVEQLRTMMPAMIKAVMAEAEVHSFEMAKAEGHVATQGELVYALLPTKTHISVGETRSESESLTVAVLDDSVWYLVRVDSPAQVEQLKGAYPELKEVELN